MESDNNNHPLFVASSPVDVKETGVSFNREKWLEVTTMFVSSKQDKNSHRRDKIKGYSAKHILYLQKYVLCAIYDVGARQDYPKLKDKIDDDGQAVLVRHGGTSVLVGTNINIVTHLWSSYTFDNPLTCFGSRAND
jgi:hypothetical protein